ncbi:MAG: CAAX prenyl protease-related protein [Isosphaeraceae bacterium]|jgi:CAAX prenyl protease-like protein|nr:MAG: CAAX prenyl protease-related protein [Isosphaeraceae bacterium]
MRVEGEGAAGWRWLPYVAPMGVFGVLTALEGQIAPTTTESGRQLYPWIYAAKIGVVGVVAWMCRGTWRDLAWPEKPAAVVWGVVLGVLVGVFWVGLDPYYPRFAWLGERSAYDPTGLGVVERGVFLVVRGLGLVVVVPLIEELFWRSFLIRWLIKPEFWEVPIGRVTLGAAAGTSALFALGHPEWLPALITGLLWAWLLAWTRSVLVCVVSHAAANATLGAIVLGTGRWEFL